MFLHITLSFLLIVVYTSLLLFLLYKITQRDRAYLSAKQLSLSFVVKIVFGLLYGFLFMRFYHGDDTWQYHDLSLAEYHKLLRHPLNFIQDTFSRTSGNISLEAAASTVNSYWSNFEEVLFIRMLAVFDVFSFGHYYVNVVLFCFVAYIGNLLFFRLLVSYYPRSSFVLLLAIFYYPIVLFWLSGIRKEGLLFLGISLTLYYFNKLLVNKFAIKNLLLFAAGIATLGLIRNMVILCLAPALAAWYLQLRFRLPALATFAGVYLLSAVLFFYSGSVPGLPDMAGKVTERQHSFMALEGNTRLELDSLHGTFSSFVHVLPQALNHSFLQPYITQSKSPLQLVSAFDIFLFFACAGLAFLYRKINWQKVFANPCILTCLFTGFAGYLLVGYIVPFPGAIVRYKSIFELLFISCFAGCVRFISYGEIKKTNILPISRQ